MPDADDVVLGQRGGGDLLAVDERSVVAAEVDDFVAAGRCLAQFGVMPGDGQVGQDEVIFGRPADAQPAAGRGQHHRRVPVHAQPVVLRPGGVARAAPWRPGGARAGFPRRLDRAHAGRRRRIALADPPGWGDGGRDGAAAEELARHHGGRVVGQGNGLAPQDRAVVAVADADNALRGDHAAADPLSPDERPVHTPGVLEDPSLRLMPQHRVPPRHARRAQRCQSPDPGRFGTWPRPLTCTPIAACGRQAPGLLPLDRSTATTCPSPAIPSPGTSAEITPLSCLRPSPGRPGTLDRVRSGLQPSTAAVAADGNDCRHPHQGRNQPRRFLAQPLRAEHTARLKVPCLTAGMIAGADSIDDMDLLRHGARLRRAGDGGGAVGRWRAGRAELPWVPGQPGCRPLPWRPDRPVRRPGYEFHDRCGPGPAG